MKEDACKNLANIVNEMAEISVVKSEVLYAKFQNTLKENYNDIIKLIESIFLGKASFYGKSEKECVNQKNEIILKFDEEFQKIFDSRKIQYISIQNEIQELSANNLIIIANFKQIAIKKIEYLNSKTYINFLKQKEEFQNIVDTTLNHAEFDKYTQLLENLVDPLEVYQKKLIALATKYDNYCKTIKECEKKLNECINATLEDFSQIVKYLENDFAISKNGNRIIKFFNIIISKITKGTGFKKNVIEKMNSELLEINDNVKTSVESIDEETISIVSTIEEVRNEINIEFKNKFNVATE